jgi:hypothetical protein
LEKSGEKKERARSQNLLFATVQNDKVAKGTDPIAWANMFFRALGAANWRKIGFAILAAWLPVR